MPLCYCQGRFPVACDMERCGCPLASGVLGGKTGQLLRGVPKNDVRCPEWQLFLRITHAALGRL
jgi:hypothetical protein